MALIFAKGDARLCCKARDGNRCCELVIVQADGATRVEQYPDRAAMLRRQHELVRAWKAQSRHELEAERVPASTIRRL
jgi:hypothetical protein